MSEGRSIGDIINLDDLNILALNGHAKDQTANAPESVDTHSDSHVILLYLILKAAK